MEDEREMQTREDSRKLGEIGARFVFRLASLVRTSRIHRMDNRAMDHSLQVAADSANQLVEVLDQARVMGEGETIHLNGNRVRLERSMLTKVHFLNDYLHERGVGGFQLLALSVLEDWRALMRVLVDAPLAAEGVDASVLLNDALTDAGIRSIRLNPVMHLSRGARGGEGGGDAESVQVAGSLALQIYLRALRLVEDFREKKGADRFHGGFRRVVKELVEQAASSPRQHMSLVNLKSSGGYEIRHPVHTAILAIALGTRIGLSRAALLDLGVSALCCDIGMAELPRELCDKAGTLSRVERSMLERHPRESVRGVLTLSQMDLSIRRWLLAGFEHHLGFDHSGYPHVLAWPDLHLFSRIIAVVETYDSLTTQRSWRDGLLPDEALSRIMEEAGTRLDPALVAHFVNMVGQYPLGTLLLLTSGEVGVVYMTPSNTEHVLRPVVRILVDGAGRTVEETKIVDLRERSSAGAFVRNVVRTVPPERLGVDVARALYS